MATENNEAVRAGEGARSATALGGLIKRDWINDHYRTIAWWVGLLLFIFIPVVKMLLDNAAVKASAWQRPDLVPGSQPYLDYLQSTPWIYVAVSMLTIAVLYGICWAFGARFFGPRRFDAHFFRWVAIGLVGTAIIQLITKIPEWVGWTSARLRTRPASTRAWP
nr:hypothetical protein [Corynebacterium lactis]